MLQKDWCQNCRRINIKCDFDQKCWLFKFKIKGGILLVTGYRMVKGSLFVGDRLPIDSFKIWNFLLHGSFKTETCLQTITWLACLFSF